MNKRSVSWSVWACSLGFGAAAFGADGVSGLELVSDGTVHRLSLPGGSAFHTSTQPISNQRLIEVAGTTAAVAMWEEGPARAQRYAVTVDGKRFSRPFERNHLVRLHNGFFDPIVGTPAVAPELAAAADNELYIVQFKTRPIEAYRQAVRQAGGTVHQFMADQAHLVRMDAEARKAVEAMPFVRWVGPVHPAYKVEAHVLSELTFADFVADRRYNIKVLESDNAMKQRVADAVVRAGGTVDSLTPNGFLLVATLNGAQLVEVLRHNDVQFVDRWGPPEEDMDIARIISGANLIEGAGGFTGAGVRGEVMDGGLRTTHVEFAGKSILIHGGNTTSFGHGTPVTGIVFAIGANPQARGLLPDADTIIFSAYQQLGDRFAHTGRLVDPNGPYRAVFQTNSWGSPQTTAYNNFSADMDNLLFAHNILITQSQSNTGNRNSRPQAWAKNIVSVGGVRHQNTLTKSDDNWGGGASIGPAADGRIKPDLTHFYDNIFTSGGSNDTNYTSTFGGTSGATPITAGYFGLFHQMWAQGVFGNDVSGGDVFDERPAASTAKAIAINTAAQYSFTNPNADLSRVKQGWGMIDMAIAYQDRDRLFVIDESEILGEFEDYARNVVISPNDPDLRVTLVYRDPAGNPQSSVARINDLSLRVVSPSGVEYWGNNGLLQGNWSTPGGNSNTIDTVENVFVQNPEPGAWRVEVIADEINQDIVPSEPGAHALFSLVIAGGDVLPDAFVYNLPADPPVAAAPGDRIRFNIEIVPGGETVDPNDTYLNYRFDDGPFISIPLTYLGDDMYEAELPVANCGDRPEFFVSAIGNDGTGTELTMPVNAPATVFRTDIGGFELIYTDNFENEAGWTVVNENLVSGAWVRDWPDAGGAWGDPTADFDGSGRCWITGNEPGRSDVNGGPTRLVTTPFELPQGTVFLELGFAEWFYNNTNDDPFWVEVSNDGENWEEIYRRVGGSGGWRVRNLTVRDKADLSQPVQFRFNTQDIGGNSITQAGIDAMSIRVFGCENTCRADINGDGVVDADDFFEFLSLFAAGDPVADMNSDGVIDADDFFEFLSLFAVGCP